MPLSVPADRLTAVHTVRRSAHADQLAAELRDARCCTEDERCRGCRGKDVEVRAARRDALLHKLTTVRPRRPS